MISAKKHHLIHSFLLLLIALTFFSVIIIAHIALQDFRLDLTQQKLWTLTDNSKKILADIKTPITLNFFFSRRLAQNFPAIASYGQNVRTMLLEMQRHAKDKIKIQYIEPEAFSENEARAQALGLRPITFINDQPLYFGLAASNQIDGAEIIPAFSAQRQHQLEYDLIQIIQTLALEQKPILGIVTSLPLDTGFGGLPDALKGKAQPFLIYQQLLKHFTIEFLEQDFAVISNRVKLLMIAHPKKLNKKTLYAIDQFVMRGGRVLAFLDPYCEISQRTNQRGKPIRGLTLTSNLKLLLNAWGVRFNPNDVVADRKQAQIVAVPDSLRQAILDRKYVLWIAANQQNINQKDIITKGLSLIGLATSGYFTPLPKQNSQFYPLITSSDDAMLLSSQYIKKSQTPDGLLAIFKPTEKKYVLAARIKGKLHSAFSKQPRISKKNNTRNKLPPYLATTKKPADIILIADSDLLEKRFWINMQAFYQQNVVIPIADNAAFVINAIDVLMGRDAIIALRSRKPHNNPFVLVNQLRQQASQKLANEEYRLRQKIKTIERKLKKSGGTLQNRNINLAALEQELLISRRSLYHVRRDLNRDIETLSFWVRFFNIAFIPIILIVIALIYPRVKNKIIKQFGAKLHHQKEQPHG